MITFKEVTLDTLERDSRDIELYFRSPLTKTPPYPALPPKMLLLETLWTSAQCRGEATPESSRAFFCAGDDRRGPFAFVSGMWHPASQSAFVDLIFRRRDPVYLRQGAALLQYALRSLRTAGARDIYMPVPDPAAWRHGESPMPMQTARFLEWSLAQGFVKAPHTYLAPLPDGSLKKGFLLLRHGGGTVSLAEATRAVRDEYRRFGISPLVASEVVYGSATFDHAKIH